ncbi:MAG: hypothetical protein R2699_15505 [Acidimicrobiales bacterium]
MIPTPWRPGWPCRARLSSCTASAASKKADGSGNVSYSPENHERMTHLRADKIAGIADDIPHQEIRGDEDAEILVVGQGIDVGCHLGRRRSGPSQGPGAPHRRTSPT